MTARLLADGTVAFLPHRLNRHPVVVRGLTADELWICSTLSGMLGAIAGLPLAILFAMIAIVPTCVVFGIALGLFTGGGLMRRLKRGRPETWLYRQLQWWIAVRHPALAPLIGPDIITRSGRWTARRTRRSRT
jgi:conjugative transfer region protein (TIGR03750 family)